MNIIEKIDKYLNESVDLTTKKLAKQNISSYVKSHSNADKITNKKAGKYAEQKVKCKNNDKALELLNDIKEYSIKNRLVVQNAPMISPTLEYRFLYNHEVIYLIDYNDAKKHKSSFIKIYYPY
jgi:hypothetical protein